MNKSYKFYSTKNPAKKRLKIEFLKRYNYKLNDCCNIIQRFQFHFLPIQPGMPEMNPTMKFVKIISYGKLQILRRNKQQWRIMFDMRTLRGWANENMRQCWMSFRKRVARLMEMFKGRFQCCEWEKCENYRTWFWMDEGSLTQHKYFAFIAISLLQKSIMGTLWTFDGDDEDWKIELQNIVNFIIVTQATPNQIRHFSLSIF